MSKTISQIIYIAAWVAVVIVILPAIWGIIANPWSWVAAVLFVAHWYFNPSNPRRTCQR